LKLCRSRSCPFLKVFKVIRIYWRKSSINYRRWEQKWERINGKELRPKMSWERLNSSFNDIKISRVGNGMKNALNSNWRIMNWKLWSPLFRKSHRKISCLKVKQMKRGRNTKQFMMNIVRKWQDTKRVLSKFQRNWLYSQIGLPNKVGSRPSSKINSIATE
jgi:hypothetical protein